MILNRAPGWLFLGDWTTGDDNRAAFTEVLGGGPMGSGGGRRRSRRRYHIRRAIKRIANARDLDAWVDT